MRVRKFVSRGGIRVYGMPVETFPGHVNNIYLIVDGDTLTLVDVGSGTEDSVKGLQERFDEMRERFGPLPTEAETLLDMARLRVTGAALGLQHVLVRGDEARLTFRAGTQPRLAGLTAALDDVQLAAEVRRTVPLSLRLVRLGGEQMTPALVRALRAVT